MYIKFLNANAVYLVSFGQLASNREEEAPGIFLLGRKGPRKFPAVESHQRKWGENCNVATGTKILMLQNQNHWNISKITLKMSKLPHRNCPHLMSER